MNIKIRQKNRLKANATIIAMVFLSSIAISLISLPLASADTEATYAFCGVIPNKTGVGQSVTLHVGISEPTIYPQLGWTGITITVTKPDNTTETLTVPTTDTTGGTGISYTPTMKGTYYFQSHFPQQTQNYAGVLLPRPANITMKASDSPIVTLTVTEEPIQYYPGQSLPTEYWTRPIDSQLREWSVIAGNWIQVPPNRYAPYNDAPLSPHILWTRYDLGGSGGGGLVGGDNVGYGYITGEAYEGKFSNSVIIGGVLYYNRGASGFWKGDPQNDVAAVDLHTGKELWVKNFNNSVLSFGQVLHWETGNAHGTYSFLWFTGSSASLASQGTVWDAYDPLTGHWVYSLTNVPSGTRIIGPNGEILIYTVDTVNNRLLRWNSTWAVKYYDIWNPANPFSNPYSGMVMAFSRYSFLSGTSAMIGNKIDASHGYDLNVSIPAGLNGAAVWTLNDRIVGTDIDIPIALGETPRAPPIANFWGISIKSGEEGKLLFNAAWNVPSDWISGNETIETTGASSDDLIGILRSVQLRRYYAVDLTTGQLKWGPTQSEYYLSNFLGAAQTNIAYGKMFTTGIGGTVWAYDIQTGNVVWSYNMTDTYVEYKIAPNWWSYLAFISDGKVYIGHGEHSAGDPKGRDAPFVCLNATTGEVIWSINGALRQGNANPVIGDSIIAMVDFYDQQIYAVGKGPTSTTVTAPNIGVQLGSSILIQGTVNDVSPGTSQDNIKLRFPKGVPAVSDASISDWMLYVYKQFAQPSNATGVPVTLSVVDANGNYRQIGTTTSDAFGLYSYSWTPDIAGKYTVYASFAGNNGYWPSSAETSFTVDQGSTPQPTAVIQAGLATSSDLLTYLAVGFLATIIAIAIVGVLLLRKK